MSRRRSSLLEFSWIRSSVAIGLIVALAFLVLFLLFKSFDLGTTSWSSNIESLIARYGLMGILLATFLAGTLVPLGSPALVATAAFYGVPKIPLILVATTGFTLGMTTNYGLARYFGRPYILSRITPDKLQEMSDLWHRWGWPLYAAFGFIPVLPVELLSLMCGFMKTRPDIFLALTFMPRLITFTMLVYLGEQAGLWIGIL